MNKMRVGSLFAGIGGFDLGFERAGMESAWQCEIDHECLPVLHRHFPRSEQHTDVHEIDSRTASRVDLLCGGFPCQDLSMAGLRKGLAGGRSGLFFELARAVDDLRPEWVVLENVVGLLSSNEGRDMGVVLGTLGELGYGWAYRVLNARYFGLAQNRERVFVVARAGGFCPPEVLFEPESVRRDLAPRRGSRQDLAACLTSGAHPNSSSAPGRHREDDANIAYSGLLAFASEAPGVARCLTTRSSDSFRDDSETYVIWNGEPRRLTAREKERLQGFDDDWTDGFGLSFGARSRMLGNAVPPPVVEWIGRRILMVQAGIDPNA